MLRNTFAVVSRTAQQYSLDFRLFFAGTNGAELESGLFIPNVIHTRAAQKTLIECACLCVCVVVVVVGGGGGGGLRGLLC